MARSVVETALLRGEFGDLSMDIHGLVSIPEPAAASALRRSGASTLRAVRVSLQSVDSTGRVVSESRLPLASSPSMMWHTDSEAGSSLLLEVGTELRTAVTASLSLAIDVEVPATEKEKLTDVPPSSKCKVRTLRTSCFPVSYCAAHILLPLYFDDTVFPAAINVEVSMAFCESPIGLPFLVLSCLANPDFSSNLLSQIEVILIGQHDGNVAILPLLESADNRYSLFQGVDKLRELIAARNDYEASTVSESILFTQLRCTLKQLHTLLPLSPSPNSQLVEKIISVANDALCLTKSCDSIDSFSIFEAHCIVVSACLWQLHQSMLIMNVLAQFPSDLSSKELLAIRQCFLLYEVYLSGFVRSEDVHDMLYQLGGHYEPEELNIIIAAVDNQNVGLCFFNDFIQWWCDG